MFKYLECTVTLVLKHPNFLSGQVPLECPWSVLELPFKCALSAHPLEKIRNTTGSGPLDSFIELSKNFSHNVLYITLIAFCFLGSRMFKFDHVLLARYNHSMWFKGLRWNPELSS